LRRPWFGGVMTTWPNGASDSLLSAMLSHHQVLKAAAVAAATAAAAVARQRKNNDERTSPDGVTLPNGHLSTMDGDWAAGWRRRRRQPITDGCHGAWL